MLGFCLHYEKGECIIPSMELLDQVRGRLRAMHYSYRTEQLYIRWLVRFTRLPAGRYASTNFNTRSIWAGRRSRSF